MQSAFLPSYLSGGNNSISKSGWHTPTGDAQQMARMHGGTSPSLWQKTVGRGRQGKAAGLGWLLASAVHCWQAMGNSDWSRATLSFLAQCCWQALLELAFQQILAKMQERNNRKGEKKNQHNPKQRFCLEQRPQGKRGLPERPLTLKRNPSNFCPLYVNFQPWRWISKKQ